MSHTEGLLAVNVDRIESKDDHGWINDGWIIAQCQGPDAIANTRRLVACWNACEGIPTESLEMGELAGLFNQFSQDTDTARQELDEAIAALRLAKSTLDQIRDAMIAQGGHEPDDFSVPEIDAVLGKYEGES